MTRQEIRNEIITGSFMIGINGLKEPVHGWEDYARKLENWIMDNLTDKKFKELQS